MLPVAGSADVVAASGGWSVVWWVVLPVSVSPVAGSAAAVKALGIGAAGWGWAVVGAGACGGSVGGEGGGGDRCGGDVVACGWGGFVGSGAVAVGLFGVRECVRGGFRGRLRLVALPACVLSHTVVCRRVRCRRMWVGQRGWGGVGAGECAGVPGCGCGAGGSW